MQTSWKSRERVWDVFPKNQGWVSTMLISISISAITFLCLKLFLLFYWQVFGNFFQSFLGGGVLCYPPKYLTLLCASMIRSEADCHLVMFKKSEYNCVQQKNVRIRIIQTHLHYFDVNLSFSFCFCKLCTFFAYPKSIPSFNLSDKDHASFGWTVFLEANWVLQILRLKMSYFKIYFKNISLFDRKLF